MMHLGFPSGDWQTMISHDLVALLLQLVASGHPTRGQPAAAAGRRLGCRARVSAPAVLRRAPFGAAAMLESPESGAISSA